MAEIRIRNLHKSFADFTAVKDSSLVLEDGKFAVLLAGVLVYSISGKLPEGGAP